MNWSYLVILLEGSAPRLWMALEFYRFKNFGCVFAAGVANSGQLFCRYIKWAQCNHHCMISADISGSTLHNRNANCLLMYRHVFRQSRYICVNFSDRIISRKNCHKKSLWVYYTFLFGFWIENSWILKAGLY